LFFGRAATQAAFHGRAIRKACAVPAMWLIVALLNFWQKLPDGTACAGERKPFPKKRVSAALVFDILCLICSNVKDYFWQINGSIIFGR
jgi:hypothetical protein